MTDTTDLLALARKATPGEWRVVSDAPNYGVTCGDRRIVQTPNQNNYQKFGRSDPWHGIETYQDAAYIAAANPSAIIALIERHNAEVERLTQIIVGKEVAMGLKEAALAAAQKRVGVLKELAREVAYDDGTRETVSEHNAFPFFSKLNQRMCMLRDKARAALAAPGEQVTNDHRAEERG